MTTQHPAVIFRNTVEMKASDFLQTMVGTDAGQRASGRVALAFRQAAQANSRLYACEPASVAQAVALSAITGLMPGGPLPDVYLLPRGNQLQWQVSHRGFAKLAARNGVRLRAKAVFDTDNFSVQEGTEPQLVHVPDLDAEQSWETLTAVYVVAHYQDGQKDFVVIRKADIEKRRANSDAWKRNSKKSPWGQWPIEMALKTGLRYAIARGIVPLDDDASAAYMHDGQNDAIQGAEARPDEDSAGPTGENGGMSVLQGTVARLTGDDTIENEPPVMSDDTALAVDEEDAEPDD